VERRVCDTLEAFLSIVRAKSAKSAYSPSFVALAFQNGVEYRNADRRVNGGDDVATSRKNWSPYSDLCSYLVCTAGGQ